MDTAKGLQKTLIQYYRQSQSTISLTPLVDSNDVQLVNFYVQPPMVAVDLQHFIGNPTKTRVTTYNQIFSKSEEETFSNIYVTAKAGYGKTVFCKKLCAVWCQTHDPMTAIAHRFTSDELSTMKKFDLLFLIPLREVRRSLCDVDKMIKSFIKNHLPLNYNDEVKQALSEQTCLVILDGLDEWVHPESCDMRQTADDIPHRKHRPNVTILTSTREWKFDAIRLPSTHIDRHVEICELDEKSSKQLTSNAVQLLNQRLTEGRAEKSVEDFYKATSTTAMGKIPFIPYVHLQCINLWFDNMVIGRSQCEIYTNIIELTLNRGMKKLQQTIPPVQLPTSVPVLQGKNYFLHHFALLQTLGKLAFVTLFGTADQQMLVIDKEFALQYLTKEELEYCLKLGLLSRNRNYGIVSRSVSNVSFEHKTIHEYFGALYMMSTGETSAGSVSSDSGKSQDIVVQSLKTISDILEMSKVFIFLSRLNSFQCHEVFSQLRKTVSYDEITRTYRSRCIGLLPYSNIEDYITRDLQTLYVDCMREMELNGQEIQTLPLEDIIVNQTTIQEAYMCTLQTLSQRNASNIKSLTILESQSSEQVTNIIERLNVLSLHSLDKIDMWCVAREQDVHPLLEHSADTLQTLSLHFNYVDKHYTACWTEMSERCSDVIINLPLLQSLFLGCLLLSHNQWENIAAFITSRTTMIQVGLYNITCTDHKKSCPGVMIDLSQHENLELLTLLSLPVYDVHVNTRQLQHCEIGDLPTGVITSCLRSLPLAKHLRYLVCYSVSEDNASTLTETIPQLLQLSEILIYYTDLGDKRIMLTPSMTRLDVIYLDKVTMTATALQDLAGTVILLNQPVTVYLWDCTVTPESEYISLKKQIRKSDRYSVILDGLYGDCGELFRFRTLT